MAKTPRQVFLVLVFEASGLDLSGLDLIEIRRVCLMFFGGEPPPFGRDAGSWGADGGPQNAVKSEVAGGGGR